MREQTWKIKLNADQLFMVKDLVEHESDRLGVIMREGVGLAATSADHLHGILWPVLEELKRLCRQG